MKILVCISLKNHPDWFKECVDSSVEAGLTDIHVCDDASDTALVDERVKIYRNEVSLGAYVSRAKVLDAIAADDNYTDDDIVVLMDGDDKFINTDNLKSAIEEAYEDNEAEIVSFNRRLVVNSYSEPLHKFSQNTLQSKDVWHWLMPYMRTFRVGLYRKLLTIDPTKKMGMCKDGRFVRSGTDRSLCSPLLLIAGTKGIKHVFKDFYHYRQYSEMTHHNRGNRGNSDIFPFLMEGFFPSLFPNASTGSKGEGKAYEHTVTFDNIYRHKKWCNGSGSGATAEYTKDYRKFLQDFLDTNAIKSVVDLGCGDWQASKLMDWRGITYTGLDVSSICVEKNNKDFASDNIRFLLSDFVSDDAPVADLIIIKDVLQHLPNKDISSILSKLGRYKFVIIVLNHGKYSSSDIKPGEFRNIDIRQAPFNQEGYAAVFKYNEKLVLMKVNH